MTALHPATPAAPSRAEGLDGLPAISLDDLNDAASLQQRVDRKYIVTTAELAATIDQLSHRLAVLEMQGKRSFRYESAYFDTPDLLSFHAAAHKRRRRFKVRTRTYLDSKTTMLEVKTRGERGKTVKARQPHPFSDRTDLDDAALDFIDSALGVPGLGDSLQFSLMTTYRRTTFVDLDDIARITVDADLRCADARNRSIELSDRFVLETKSSSSPGVVDRHLWRMGVRPAKISKYGTGLAALDPALPSNKWHRTLNRHFL